MMSQNTSFEINMFESYSNLAAALTDNRAMSWVFFLFFHIYFIIFICWGVWDVAEIIAWAQVVPIANLFLSFAIVDVQPGVF